MSLRAFKEYTIVAGGTPQPLIGTTITAAVGPVAYPQGIPGPNALLSITVADNSMFQSGDWAMIGKPSTGEERLQVMSISSTTIVKALVPYPGGLTGTYLSGAYFRLGNAINSSFIQTIIGNSGAIYIGTKDTMVKAGYVFVVATLEPVTGTTQPTYFSDDRTAALDPDDIGQLWVDGTTGDGYLPSYGVI
jgi:hypothetical protein